LGTIPRSGGFNTRDLISRRYHEPAQWRTEKGTGPQKKKTGTESEAPGKRDEAFTQEEIGKRRGTIKKEFKYEG